MRRRGLLQALGLAPLGAWIAARVPGVKSPGEVDHLGPGQVEGAVDVYVSEYRTFEPEGYRIHSIEPAGDSPLLPLARDGKVRLP